MLKLIQQTPFLVYETSLGLSRCLGIIMCLLIVASDCRAGTAVYLVLRIINSWLYITGGLNGHPGCAMENFVEFHIWKLRGIPRPPLTEVGWSPSWLSRTA